MTNCPYPNVVGRRGRRWYAYCPSGSPQRKYLGAFTTAEAAWVAVLEAQAANLEARAAGYRTQAAALKRENGARHA